jgi:DNA topoisomerase-1
MKRLIIVESPTKAKTIKKLLGDSYKVVASFGHVVDLPTDRMGVDIGGTFDPEFCVIKGKAKIISELKRLCREADEVYFASDPDREGEAIAWHLKRIIGLDNKVLRITFNEISKEAIEEALKKPRDIDLNLVGSYLARRVLDRIFGYSLSPLLWRRFKSGLSAGRVQSVALKLICDREREIRNFKVKEYYRVKVKLVDELKREFFTYVTRYRGKKVDKIESEELARGIANLIKSGSIYLFDVIEKLKKEKPPPPFTTSTLQQSANSMLGYPVSLTMRIAQDLYEGLDIPGFGRRSLITYMRTDSTRISEKAAKSLKDFVRNLYGDEYVGKIKPRNVRFKNVQDSHEAIRPVDVFLKPDDISGRVKKEHWKLYELIHRRSVASSMSEAKILVKTFLFRLDPFDLELETKRQLLVFDGFYRVWRTQGFDEDLSLTKGRKVEVVDLEVEKEKTEPPPRFTEASLIKVLDEKGVGRPSTYAVIISTLLKRGYVERKKKTLVPTELGIRVCELLELLFPDLMDVKFTSQMEEGLDRIASGESSWKDVVKVFYDRFEWDYRKAMEAVKNNDI